MFDLRYYRDFAEKQDFFTETRFHPKFFFRYRNR